MVSFFSPRVLWALAQGPILLIVGAFLVQAFLIVSLLLSRAQKREAEKECERLKRLEENESKRLNDLITNVPGIVWETRIDPVSHHHTTTFVSQQAEKMLGYTTSEWLSTPDFCLQLIHEEDRERVERELEEIFSNTKQGLLHFRWIAKDKHPVSVKAQVAAITDDGGRTIGSHGVTVDVTEQELAESARLQSVENNRMILEALGRNEAQSVDQMRASEERFSKVFRLNPQPMSLTTAATGLYIDVNESFLAMSGYTRDEVIGKTSLELRIWETSDARAEFVRQLHKRGSLVNYETKFRAKDGSFRVLLSSAEELEIGGKRCLLVASSDVTEGVAAQQALQESEERFRSMADTAPVMIWIVDAARRCTYVNKQWLDFTGRPTEEELGQGWMQGIHPEDYEACLESYISSFDERRPVELEYRVRRYDGEYRWVYDTGIPRFSSDGTFLGYIGSAIDITERKESEVALQTAHEELHQLKNQLEAENISLQQELQLDQKFGEIVGQSNAIKYVLFKIAQVAPTDSTVLITGETGTGKELVARAIHGASARTDRPLIKVNCGALSPTLIESELFGHEKGAFTGAVGRKQGRFELANGGTLFLDEIGDLPLELQVKLLRVIQESEFERLGGGKTINVDVRIIAATNRNLKLEVEQGTFREDLWYRLNVYPITMPPLRQRKEDIPVLVEHFVSTYARKFGKTISSVSPRTMQSLQDHSWPGNIRELANVVERAVIHSQGSVLQVVDRFELVADDSTPTQTLEEVERDYITRTLENTGWRIEGKYGAARILGLNPSTLRTRMLKLGIQRRAASFTASDSRTT
jgi:PAS domain S-box-containing protein